MTADFQTLYERTHQLALELKGKNGASSRLFCDQDIADPQILTEADSRYGSILKQYIQAGEAIRDERLELTVSNVHPIYPGSLGTRIELTDNLAGLSFHFFPTLGFIRRISGRNGIRLHYDKHGSDLRYHYLSDERLPTFENSDNLAVGMYSGAGHDFFRPRRGEPVFASIYGYVEERYKTVTYIRETSVSMYFARGTSEGIEYRIKEFKAKLRYWISSLNSRIAQPIAKDILALSKRTKEKREEDKQGVEQRRAANLKGKSF